MMMDIILKLPAAFGESVSVVILNAGDDRGQRQRERC